ncbi:MerR family transcriptional regulator [Hoyosella sp. G463]|uniref:MerR family transcriptional regulator n=1 Tax=Lolliginicoccus lacisalsi TaxID=2742202 RepID=A0A927PL40_9ACTN|nr:MerR family transcriptional regulator [Lolliginicoccus lacisalsi]MBD8506705.1 MerR family transcriptional regulator [Lolliginicoccus lacisalsi]
MLIGEVSQHSGVSTRMLRHYESLGLVTPTGRTPGGYREYSRADIQRILHVESLRSLGLSLRDVQRALDDPAFAPSTLFADLIRRTRQRIDREQELLARLRKVEASDPAQWGDVLSIIKLLRALGSEHPALRQQAVLSATHRARFPVEVLAESALAEPDPNVAGALMWALARAGVDGLAGVAPGLAAPDAATRRRAAEAIAAVPGPEAIGLLEVALADTDDRVRARAALELGARGQLAALPTLIDMVIEGVSDVEAAEKLGALAVSPSTAEQIVGTLVAALGSDPGPRERLRLAQALAEIPGAAPARELVRMTQDDDRSVALTAMAILADRDPPERGARSPGK